MTNQPRPAETSDENTIVRFECPVSVVELLDTMCIEDDRSRSSMLRHLIRQEARRMGLLPTTVQIEDMEAIPD